MFDSLIQGLLVVGIIVTSAGLWEVDKKNKKLKNDIDELKFKVKELENRK